MMDDFLDIELANEELTSCTCGHRPEIVAKGIHMKIACPNCGKSTFVYYLLFGDVIRGWNKLIADEKERE